MGERSRGGRAGSEAARREQAGPAGSPAGLWHPPLFSFFFFKLCKKKKTPKKPPRKKEKKTPKSKNKTKKSNKRMNKN